MGVNAQRMQEVDFYLSKENLEKYLPIYSANYIATKLFYPKFITTAGTVIDRARKLNIKTHTVSSATNLKSSRDLYVETCKIKYNCTNVSQVKFVKKKKIQSAINKYGCENVFQSDEIKEKSKETLYNKYGVTHVTQLETYNANNGKISKPHKIISDFLKSQNIKHKNEIIFSKFNNIYNKIYSPRADIVIEDIKLIIEINGDLWHANPKLFKKNDFIKTWGGNQTAAEIWEKDRIKKAHMEDFGYKVYYIWQNDIQKNLDLVQKDLLREIKKNKKYKKNR